MGGEGPVRPERTSVMSTDHGRIVLIEPGRLTADDLADFEAWIAIVMRRMWRQAEATARDGAPDAG